MKRFLKYNILILISTCPSCKREEPIIKQKDCKLVIQPGIDDSRTASVDFLSPDSTLKLATFEATCNTAAGFTDKTESLICFDLSPIPVSAQIDSAFLYINHESTSQKSDPSELLRVLEEWNDKYITWNSLPLTTQENKVVIPSHYQQSLRLDLTSFCKFWVQNPSMNFGMLYKLYNESVQQSSVFVSALHENASLRPKLIVHYSVTPDKNCTCSENPTPPVRSVNTIISNTSVVFELSSSNSIDTYVYSNQPAENFSHASDYKLTVGRDSYGEYWSLIWFNLPKIENLVKVKKAIFFLYTSSGTVERIDSMEIMLVGNSSWDKNVVWNTRPTPTIVREIVTPAYAKESFISVDISTLVEYWISNPSINHGMVIKLKNPSTVYNMVFASSRNPSISSHPRLVIEYSYKKPVN